MANKEEKIKKLEDEIDYMETSLTNFGNLFNEDGNIDKNEQAQLDSMKRTIRKVRAKIASLKKGNKPTVKKEEVPKSFRLGINKLQQYIESMQVYLEKAENDQKINSKRWDKMVQNAGRTIFKLRKLYSNTSDSVFEECNTMIASEENQISDLKQKANGLDARIAAAKKSEVKLDGNMKALLKAHNSCPRTLYKHLEEKMQKVERNFQQFITANL